jgi:hypothetical protein
VSELLEMLLGLGLEAIGSILELWIDTFEWSDTWASRIFWSVILTVLGGWIWWELR